MAKAWRIVPEHRAREAFTGEGARLYGGRWNSVGTAAIYTSEHQSLAALELLVHIGATTPVRFLAFPLDWEVIVEQLPAANLPANWRAEPPPRSTMLVGDSWAREARAAILAVPSAIIPAERNFLLNPGHRDFEKIRIGTAEPFMFDRRLL